MALEYVKETYLKLFFKNILAKKFIKKIEKKGNLVSTNFEQRRRYLLILTN